MTAPVFPREAYPSRDKFSLGRASLSGISESSRFSDDKTRLCTGTFLLGLSLGTNGVVATASMQQQRMGTLLLHQPIVAAHEQ